MMYGRCFSLNQRHTFISECHVMEIHYSKQNGIKISVYVQIKFSQVLFLWSIDFVKRTSKSKINYSKSWNLDLEKLS